MSAAVALSPDLLRPTPASPSAATRERIADTAREFEATFLSQMIGVMFSGMETAAPFGGGHGEDAFRSFLSESMGRTMARAGGVGLSASIQREMLRMQGLE